MHPQLVGMWARLTLDRLAGLYACIHPPREDLCLPNPRCITRASLALVQPSVLDWVIAPKTDGVRVVVIRCVLAGVQSLLSVGRRYDTQILWSAECHSGAVAEPGVLDTVCTVLDAERLPDGTLSAHDVFVVSSTVVHDRPHHIRMCLLEDAVSEATRGTHGVALAAKAFVPLSDAAVTDALAASADGLILAHRAKPVTFGSDPALLKWKPPDRATIDLFVERRRCGAHYGRTARARASDSTRIIIDRIDCNAVPGPLPAIWEFAFRDGAWHPLRRRDDKAKANTLYVVEQTASNVTDVIRPDELCAPPHVAISTAPKPEPSL